MISYFEKFEYNVHQEFVDSLPSQILSLLCILPLRCLQKFQALKYFSESFITSTYKIMFTLIFDQ